MADLAARAGDENDWLAHSLPKRQPCAAGCGRTSANAPQVSGS
jgi:hypothetical protein